jgi:sulfate/thiosulfate transport system ATP-binding protein
MSIEAVKITKKFGNFTALKDVDLEVPSGELVALLGPSGSGKTTLLRIIAGLEIPDSGWVRFEGHDITDRSTRERQVGFVFQHYALFRHMTVFENIAFGLRVRPRQFRPSEKEIRAKVHELLRLVQLEQRAGRFPNQLSGGQRQRIALARALAVEPKVLLLDEPFGALDAKVRQELRRWLRRLHDEIHITSLFVTHDQEEALEVADRVVVMNEGMVEQAGTPDEVYHHPSTPFVYNFLGNVNLFHGRIEDNKAYISGAPGEDIGQLSSPPQETVFYVRPHLMDIDHHPNGNNYVRATVRHINSAGPLVKVEVVTQAGDSVHVELTQERFEQLQLKKNVEVFVFPKDMKVFIDYQI